MSMWMIRTASGALLLSLLAGCSILPKAEVPNVYLLPSAKVPAATGKPVTWTLRVTTPQASGLIDSNRIAVVPGEDTITTYKASRWSDRAPTLLRDRLIDTFRADGRVAAVSNDDTNLHADRELDGQLRSFQSEYENGGPVAVVRYDVQLVDAADHRILATKNFEVREPAAGKDVPQVVAAFGRASDALAAEVVAWSVAR
ncbi:ABC-type transport auxiliary lipoprotein family protein [Pinirhizobacter soli]|uniref:ABC-type transport auxiliary lipoprotein family protein n=1 Tax=Pinirhizobacter soli TaxID=2786953 RepID=UPI00202A6E8D|nr:ABC-type transport auxiliary lipoprotein family protein [Pinirhizobacter soli]